MAEYMISGNVVEQRLPAPIRAAQAKDEAPVPAPWMSLGAMARFDTKGEASVKASWRLNTDFPAFLDFFRRPGAEHADRLDTWKRRTDVAIWLVARRRGAPLDRFSVVPIDGRVYKVVQNFDVDIRRVKGELILEDQPIPGVEHEKTIGFGRFHASKTSEESADSGLMRFGNPAAGEIDLSRHSFRFFAPPAPPKTGGMGVKEFQELVGEILDSLVVFDFLDVTSEEAKGIKMERLGFVFTPLTITITLSRRTGRISGTAAKVESTRMGNRALFHLAKALTLRLEKRDFLKRGRSIALGAGALKELPGSGDEAIVRFTIPPHESEPDLTKDDELKRDFAVMWSCAEQQDPLEQRELGAVYWMDRDGVLHRFPEVGLILGEREKPEGFNVAMPKDPNLISPAGFIIGTAHTHPPPDEFTFAPPGPSDEDMARAREGETARQHFVVDRTGVTAYFSDGTKKHLESMESVLKKGIKCNDKDFSKPHKPGK
jgi:hypothetical protein